MRWASGLIPFLRGVRNDDVSAFPWGRERIEPGAFSPLGDVILNRQHKRDIPLARTAGVTFQNSVPSSPPVDRVGTGENKSAEAQQTDGRLRRADG